LPSENSLVPPFDCYSLQIGEITKLMGLAGAKFRVGAFLVDPSRNRIARGDSVFSLEPQVMNVLCVLAENPDEVKSRDDLIDRVWQVKFGADEGLTRAISQLRKTFRKAGETFK